MRLKEIFGASPAFVIVQPDVRQRYKRDIEEICPQVFRWYICITIHNMALGMYKCNVTPDLVSDIQEFGCYSTQ